MPLEIKGLINPTNTSIPTTHLAEFHDGGLEPTDSFTVTKNLTHAVISNEQITNTSYYANVEPETGWSGLTVTIKVGGVDMSNLYQSGTISIPNVTGNIVITAVAAQAPLTSITAVYTQSGTVYDTDTLDSLKSDLVVTANYEDSTTATIASTDYTLSGTLAEGTSTITVTYGGKTTTFTVTVSQFVNGLANGQYTKTNGGSDIYITVTDTNHLTWGNSIANYAQVNVPFKAPITIHSGDVISVTCSTGTAWGGSKNIALAINPSLTRMTFNLNSNTTATKSQTADSDYTAEHMNFMAYAGTEAKDFYVTMSINNEVIF